MDLSPHNESTDLLPLSRRKAFFSSFEEGINLLTPILFLILLIPQFVDDYAFSLHENVLLNIYTNIFLLSVAHIGFFIAFPLIDPSSRVWFFGINDRFKKKYLISAAAVFLGSFLVFCFSLGVFPNETHFGKIAAGIGLTLTLVAPSFHYLRQSYGLSRLYDKEKKPRRVSLDFYGFHVLLILVVFVAINPKFHYWGLISGTNALIFMIASSLLISLFMTAHCVVQNPSKLGVKKALFQSRLILIPVSFFNPLGGLFSRAIHGIEYYYIMKGLFKKKDYNFRFVLMLIFLFLLVALLSLGHKDSGLPALLYLNQPKPYWVLVGTSLLQAIAQVHFWTEHHLFSHQTADRIGADTPVSRLRENLSNS